MSHLLPQRAIVWTILGIIVAIFAYPGWGIFPLAFFVVPCFLAAVFALQSARQAFWLGVLATTIAGFGGYTWITFVLTEMGGVPLPVALLLHAGFNLICLPNYNAFFLLGFWLVPRVEKLSLPLRPLFWALLWTSLEFLFRFIKIFPEMLGNTIWPWLEVTQVVSWGGTAATSLLVSFFGFALFYVCRFPKNRIAYAPLIFSLALLGASHIWGASRITRLQELPTELVHVAMVQANIGNTDKAIAIAGVNAGIQRVVQQYKDLTAVAAESRPELILWPETAYPMAYPATGDAEVSWLSRVESRFIEEKAKAQETALLIGGYERASGKEYNSVVLIGADGEPKASYRKFHLLIVGEYMPFSDWFPALKRLNPQLGNFGHGAGPHPLRWERSGKRTLQLGVNICYEALIMSYMRELALNGSDVFVNFSNDSWFGPGSEPYQHLMVTAHRIIENGIPMIRSTNTGITGFIDVTGRLVKSGPLFAPTVVEMKFPIPLEPVPTFYRQFGELFAWALVLVTIIFLIALRKGRNFS